MGMGSGPADHYVGGLGGWRFTRRLGAVGWEWAGQ